MVGTINSNHLPRCRNNNQLYMYVYCKGIGLFAGALEISQLLCQYIPYYANSYPIGTLQNLPY